MRPLTLDVPKALARVLGEPILAHQLRWLSDNRIPRVVVACSYKWRAIDDYLRTAAFPDLDVRLAVEDEPLGRGGAVRNALSILEQDGDEPLIVMNGDLIGSFRLGDLADRLRETDAAAAITVTPIPTSWGVVDIKGTLVCSFVQGGTLPVLGSAGVYCFSREALSLLPERGDHEETTLPELARRRKLAAYEIRDGLHFFDSLKDIATYESLAELRKA
jgi:NDP-sugar pyrophosphorylase family protein